MSPYSDEAEQNCLSKLGQWKKSTWSFRGLANLVQAVSQESGMFRRLISSSTSVVSSLHNCFVNPSPGNVRVSWRFLFFLLRPLPHSCIWLYLDPNQSNHSISPYAYYGLFGMPCSFPELSRVDETFSFSSFQVSETSALPIDVGRVNRPAAAHQTGIEADAQEQKFYLNKL